MAEAVKRFKEIQAKNRLGGGPKHIERQHDRGKLTARERIEILVDPGTGFPGIDNFMDRIVGGEHLSHRHDAEVRLQDTQKIIIDFIVFAILPGFLQFLVEDRLDDGFRSGGSELRSRPGINEIRAHFTAAHDNIRAAIGASQHQGYFRICQMRIAMQVFGAVADDTAALPFVAGRVGRRI